MVFGILSKWGEINHMLLHNTSARISSDKGLFHTTNNRCIVFRKYNHFSTFGHSLLPLEFTVLQRLILNCPAKWFLAIHWLERVVSPEMQSNTIHLRSSLSDTLIQLSLLMALRIKETYLCRIPSSIHSLILTWLTSNHVLIPTPSFYLLYSVDSFLQDLWS